MNGEDGARLKQKCKINDKQPDQSMRHALQPTCFDWTNLTEEWISFGRSLKALMVPDRARIVNDFVDCCDDLVPRHLFDVL